MAKEAIRILIVEDEGISAMDLQDTLELLGYTVVAVAATGEDAIAYTEQHQPDLVLMDINLAGDMDGITAAQEIRNRYDTAVIYTTAFSDDSLIQRAVLTQPFGYIIKPYNRRELHSNIEIAIFKSRMIAEHRLTMLEGRRLYDLCMERESRIRELEEQNQALQEAIVDLVNQLPDVPAQ